MSSKARYTKAEMSLRTCMLLNLAQEVSYRVDRHNECDDISTPIARRRQRELMKAIERLAEAYAHRPSDGALRYYYGEREVQRRNKLLGAAENVIPLKRRGLPVG